MEKLDALALNIELTLISIIQGVALYFLVDSSRSIIVDRDLVYWPYIATGLVMILIFWSRSIMHSLTVVHWPLDFGRNFLYVVCTMLEAVAFTQIRRPEAWFAANAANAAAVWVLFAWDLGLIRGNRRDARSDAAKHLFAAIEADQNKNLRVLMPVTLAFNLGAAAAIHYYPEFFLNRNGHLGLIGFQFIAALVYLVAGMRFFRNLDGFMRRIVGCD